MDQHWCSANCNNSGQSQVHTGIVRSAWYMEVCETGQKISDLLEKFEHHVYMFEIYASNRRMSYTVNLKPHKNNMCHFKK
jgi:membrane-anchored protein YejM (alkaline phosphatase superfamily)